MIKISEKQLRELEACEDGIQWFLNQKKRTLKTIIPALLKDNHFDYAKWLLSNLMTHPQRVMWAISSAKSVLKLFENKYPHDLRPRAAIEAAEGFLKGKVTADAANAAYAAYAAYAAANAAANAANAADAVDAANAAYAAYAAANAADAANAAYAAYAAANAAANAVDAANAANAAYAAVDAANAANAAYAADAVDAANAANAAYAANAARKTAKVRLCNEALKILGEI